MKVEMTVGTSTSGSLINRHEWFSMSDVCLARKLITDYRSSPLIKRVERPSMQVSSISIVCVSCRRRQVAGTKMTTTTNETGNDEDVGDDANQICHLYLMSAVMKSLFACEQNAENANWEMGVHVATRIALCFSFSFVIFSLKHEHTGEGWHPSLSRSWLAIISRNGTDAAFSTLSILR